MLAYVRPSLMNPLWAIFETKEPGSPRRNLFLESRVLFSVSLVVALVCAGLDSKSIDNNESIPSESNVLGFLHTFPAFLAGIAILKVVLGLLAVATHARLHKPTEDITENTYVLLYDEENSLELMEGNGGSAQSRSIPSKPSQHAGSEIFVFALALLLTAKPYLAYFIVLKSAHFLSAHPDIYSMASSSSVLLPAFTTVILCVLQSKIIPTQQCLGIVLQICGFLSTHNFYAQAPSMAPFYLAIAFTLYSSSVSVLNYYIYHLHSPNSPHRLNYRLFLYSLAIHVSLAILASIWPASFNPIFPIKIMSLIFLAFAEFATMNIVFCYGPVMLAVLTLLSTVLFTTFIVGVESIASLCGLFVSFIGFGLYIMNESSRDSIEAGKKINARVLMCIVLLPLAYITTQTLFLDGTSNDSDLMANNTSHSPEAFGQFETLMLMENVYAPPTHEELNETQCTRFPLPSLNYFDGERVYHHFDDVLLIVFFSHARYDANLDYYREVYAEFFPNMVFVGPKSREDMGFEHSYDVFVDSYESDEDISDWSNYRMAGRMAHHMLYTVLTSPPYSNGCYKGFLWAPFDTLLNIPRLQLFDQSKIWYFSPWGKYVPNPAVDEEAWMNASYHAPPARISPDPETNWEETFRGWWIDWWWGDPHYGIPVCSSAFARISSELRERMSNRFLDGETRYIGGSADTLYLPARLVPSFVDVLGAFLNTSCFLEIAVPTAVHLIVPPEEDILFVDHWWIWEEPLNVTFVRNTWAKGMEVDTFHTFHWGDKDLEGVWHARPENIDDVRRLQHESAARQGLEWLTASGT